MKGLSREDSKASLESGAAAEELSSESILGVAVVAGVGGLERVSYSASR